jgi:hypothetical protein
MVITAPLTRVRREIEVPLLGLAATTQILVEIFHEFDDQSVAATLATLIFLLWAVWRFAPRLGSPRRLGSSDNLKASF